MANDNYSFDRGFGLWEISIYNPSQSFGPYSGFLTVSKEFHVVHSTPDDKGVIKCIASFPSQNVAAAINKEFQNVVHK